MNKWLSESNSESGAWFMNKWLSESNSESGAWFMNKWLVLVNLLKRLNCSFDFTELTESTTRFITFD